MSEQIAFQCSQFASSCYMYMVCRWHGGKKKKKNLDLIAEIKFISLAFNPDLLLILIIKF